MRSSGMVRQGVIPVACAVALSLSGCDATGGSRGDVAEATGAVSSEGPVPFAESGRWEGETSNGARLSVKTADLPLRPGPLSLRIQLEDAEPEPLPVSVDLVAPEMPMHGIRRFDAEAVSPVEYLVNLEVPMEGRWLLYINLDIGVNAAALELDVAAPEGAGHEQGARDGSPEPDSVAHPDSVAAPDQEQG